MRRLILGGCFAVALAWSASGGGGPFNTLVVVNDASPDSLDIGWRYARARGIPERNVFHIHSAETNQLDALSWTNVIRDPILAYLTESGLSGQVDRVVFAPGTPYRIYEGPLASNQFTSLTSAMYYDVYTSPDILASFICHLNGASGNVYAFTERAFERADTPGGRYLLSALLTGSTGDAARRLAERTAAADYTQPTGSVHLLRTTDGLRSVRWPLHEEADFRSRLPGRANAWFLRTENSFPATNNVLGFMTGDTTVSTHTAHGYLPGAYSDHLTSFGGILFAPPGQMSILAWLNAGSGGSSGTVIEPCAYTQKFADPMLYAWYERGFSLGEAYYMAVRNPYQTIFTGDPLLQPYARPSAVSFAGWTNGAVVSGVVTLAVEAVAAASNLPLARIDVFLDGVRAHTTTNTGLAPGTVFELVLNTRTMAYAAVAGDTVYAVASNLAREVNLANTSGPPPDRIPFRATNLGDSVQLVWTNFGASGAGQTISARALPGTASVLRAQAWSFGANFMDPAFPAHEILGLSGTATTGDVLETVITLTNGVMVTNRVTAGGVVNAFTLLGQLQASINGTSALQGVAGVEAAYLQRLNNPFTLAQLVLQARTNGVAGIGLHVTYSILLQPGSTLNTNDVFQDFFNDNAATMRPRALVRVAEGVTNLQTAWAFDTTLLPNGPLRLDAVAIEGTAVRAQGRARLDLVVSNSPFRCLLAAPPAWHHVLRGGAVTTEAVVADAVGAVTQVAFFVEGKLAGTTGAPPYTFVWATTNRAIGAISVQARADTDAGAAALSESRRVVIYTDADADGLSDQWEYDAFGSATNRIGTDDPDGDGVDNRGEFFADTNPADPASFLRVESQGGAPVEFTFPARTTRVYRIGYVDDTLDGAWLAATGTLSGIEGPAAWVDTPSNAPPAPGALRAYRVETGLP